jgi:hypothetical protein
MNIQELYDQLEKCLNKFESKNVNGIAKIDLEIFVSQIKKKMLEGEFDPLKELDQVTVPNVSKLPEWINQVSDVIVNEKERVDLVNKLISLTKMGLNATGLNL